MRHGTAEHGSDRLKLLREKEKKKEIILHNIHLLHIAAE